MPQRRRRQNGKGLFSSIGKAFSGVNNFLKNTKAISTIGSLIPHAGAQKVSGVAGALGYGRRRRPRRTAQKGKGLFDIFSGLLGMGKKRRVRKVRLQ